MAREMATSELKELEIPSGDRSQVSRKKSNHSKDRGSIEPSSGFVDCADNLPFRPHSASRRLPGRFARRGVGLDSGRGIDRRLDRRFDSGRGTNGGRGLRGNDARGLPRSGRKGIYHGRVGGTGDRAGGGRGKFSGRGGCESRSFDDRKLSSNSTTNDCQQSAAEAAEISSSDGQPARVNFKKKEKNKREDKKISKQSARAECIGADKSEVTRKLTLANTEMPNDESSDHPTEGDFVSLKAVAKKRTKRDKTGSNNFVIPDENANFGQNTANNKEKSRATITASNRLLLETVAASPGESPEFERKPAAKKNNEGSNFESLPNDATTHQAESGDHEQGIVETDFNPALTESLEELSLETTVEPSLKSTANEQTLPADKKGRDNMELSPNYATEHRTESADQEPIVSVENDSTHATNVGCNELWPEATVELPTKNTEDEQKFAAKKRKGSNVELLLGTTAEHPTECLSSDEYTALEDEKNCSATPDSIELSLGANVDLKSNVAVHTRKPARKPTKERNEEKNKTMPRIFGPLYESTDNQHIAGSKKDQNTIETIDLNKLARPPSAYQPVESAGDENKPAAKERQNTKTTNKHLSKAAHVDDAQRSENTTGSNIVVPKRNKGKKLTSKDKVLLKYPAPAAPTNQNSNNAKSGKTNMKQSVEEAQSNNKEIPCQLNRKEAKTKQQKIMGRKFQTSTDNCSVLHDDDVNLASPTLRAKSGSFKNEQEAEESARSNYTVPPYSAKRKEAKAKQQKIRGRKFKKSTDDDPVLHDDDVNRANSIIEAKGRIFKGQQECLDKLQRQLPKRKARSKKIQYPEHTPYNECLALYISSTKSKDFLGQRIIRGKMRVMPGCAAAFVSCDRGSLDEDVVIETEMARNRAMDGDWVFVELIGLVKSTDVVPVDVKGTDKDDDEQGDRGLEMDLMQEECVGNVDSDCNDYEEKPIFARIVDNSFLKNDDVVEKYEGNNVSNEIDDHDFEDYIIEEQLDSDDESDDDDATEFETDHKEYFNEKESAINDVAIPKWRDDEVQRSLWDPRVNIDRIDSSNNATTSPKGERYQGRVICVVPPKMGGGKQPSELDPGDEGYLSSAPCRTIVGTLMKVLGEGNRFLLNPNNRCLPRFMTLQNTCDISNENSGNEKTQLYRGEYEYGSWSAALKWPPCINLKPMGNTCNVKDETMALLVEYGVDHGEFQPNVLKDVDEVVSSGRILENCKPVQEHTEAQQEIGWAPTPDMYKGRRDYRRERIFTIDPTTAKDLDDAVHIRQLSNDRVEIGVHIADVSYFVTPGTALDDEAGRRATTVYLVDRTVPMLPRPLCEIACSLNENVERLTFSCVWTMNMDGTLENKDGKEEDNIWYGRSVIKSCARLDYATAQNIIDLKVANGEESIEDESLWPKSRQPTGGHTIDKIAEDIRLMHKIAMARRSLRLQNGALALNGVKLAFQLENDGETPALCEPYPIRDSNRLIEEFMLMANYLVAQRLITHAGGLSLLRHHPPPLNQGMQTVVQIAKESTGFHIDAGTSKSLQESLSRLGRECDDDLVMECVTVMLMTPMQPADYFCAGEVKQELWRHFALNIPYYTHFTSPIRRYPDIMVHRLLQATIDADNMAIKNIGYSQSEVQSVSNHCNDKRMAAKKASERSDRVFLSLYLRSNPVKSALGVVLSVGEKTFTVYVPSLGLATMAFVDDHKDLFDITLYAGEKERRMVMTPRKAVDLGVDPDSNREPSWSHLTIRIFAKLSVSCHCKEKPPMDVRIKVVGPWQE